MTQAADHYDRLLARNYTWMLGGDLAALAAGQAELLRDAGVTAPATGGLAVDLGCGPGNQSLALAGLGFARVLAVDTSAVLLDELAAAGEPAIRPVRADLRTVLPQVTAPGEADVIVCMGDTLTHLPGKDDVTALLGDVAAALGAGGRLVITYRDLTRPLTGTDRFLLVRATGDRMLTCFLEYGADTVQVHDLLHTRTGGTWTLQASSYPKLRLDAAWLAAQCATAGLTVRHSAPGPRGMHLLVAVKT